MARRAGGRNATRSRSPRKHSEDQHSVTPFLVILTWPNAASRRPGRRSLADPPVAAALRVILLADARLGQAHQFREGRIGPAGSARQRGDQADHHGVAVAIERAQVHDRLVRYTVEPPTAIVRVIDTILDQDGKRPLERMRWGLIPSWKYCCMSASAGGRARTLRNRLYRRRIASTPSFRAPAARQQASAAAGMGSPLRSQYTG